MNIKRNHGIARHSLATMTFTLALAGTNVAGATAVSSVAGDTPIPLAGQTVDASHDGPKLENSVVYGQGNDARYSANLWPPPFSVCGFEGCEPASNVMDVPALGTSMKWRANSFSIAGSRVWSKLFVFTSTSINVRLPIN